MMSGKVLIYGIGVIGSVYAVRLAKAGFKVTAVARGERLEAIRSGGLRIRNAFLGDEETAQVEVVEELPEGAHFDLVLVAVRGGQIEDALGKIARLERSGAVAVIGNNLGDYKAQAELVGAERFVLGFGAFGGYREGGAIVYVDGRTKKHPGDDRRSKTTLGVISPDAHPALDIADLAFGKAGLPTSECADMRSWLACHAALVFPLAGAMYAAGGEQARVSRTRDAIILGVRACRELFVALKRLGYAVEPRALKRLLAMPEWLIARVLRKTLASEGARVALFGHANAPGGRGEVGSQAKALDAIVRSAGTPLHSWDALLPYYAADGKAALIPDGSKDIQLRFW